MSDLSSAKWAKADIDQVAVSHRNFMSTHPNLPRPLMVGAFSVYGFNEQIFGANEQVSRPATTPLEKRSALCLAERKRPNSTLNLLCFNLPRPATYPRVAGVSSLAATNKSLAQMNKSLLALSKKCTL